MSLTKDSDTLILFDVDGTLTPSRRLITKDIEEFLDNELKPRYTVGLVGGSNLEKIAEQMGGPEVTKKFDYVFAENGLVAYKAGELLGKESIVSAKGEDMCQKIINFALKYMSNIQLPLKRGNFVEFRNGMINLCPIGRSCTLEERLGFVELDQNENIRKKFQEALYQEFPNAGFSFAIGGQISIDVFPVGWDKRFCLKFVEKDFKTIHFFGDKTAEGGNDHEIFADDRTIGHTVTDPQDTVRQLKKTFGI